MTQEWFGASEAAFACPQAPKDRLSRWKSPLTPYSHLCHSKPSFSQSNTILDLASHNEDMETEAQRFPQRDIISPCIPALSYMVATSHMRLFKFKMKN